jgi:hypothetical protein
VGALGEDVEFVAALGQEVVGRDGVDGFFVQGFMVPVYFDYPRVCMVM